MHRGRWVSDVPELEIIAVDLVSPSQAGVAGLWLDSPVSGSVADGRALDLEGWLLSPDGPATSFEIRSDGRLLRRLAPATERSDVAAQFPKVPRAARCGFRTTLRILRLDELHLDITAHLADRRRVEIARIRLRGGWRQPDWDREAPLVSVIIPCRDQGRYLSAAIESVAAQTYPHVEIVVVDDGSFDNTTEVAGRYPGVRCVSHENRGLAAARNSGIRSSNGSFLLFLDADDRLTPDALEIGLRELETHPSAAFAAGHHRLIGADGSVVADWPRRLPADDPYMALLRENFIAVPAAVLYRRSALEEVGVFDQQLASCADFDLYLRTAANYPIRVHDRVVAEYRRHGANMSRRPERMLREVMLVLRRQSLHLRSREHHRAVREGRRFWLGLYGPQLAERCKALIARHDFRAASACVALLMRSNPRDLFHLALGMNRNRLLGRGSGA